MENQIKDYYQILNLSRVCSQGDIKRNFRTLVKKWHPDLNRSEVAHQRILEINEAYEILSDQAKRTLYDELFEEFRKPTSYKRPEYDAKVSQMEEWTTNARLHAEKIIKDGLKVFEKTLEAGAVVAKTTYNIVSTLIGVVLVGGAVINSFIYMFRTLILKEELELDGGRIVGLGLTIFFLLILFGNVILAILGKDSIFKKVS